MEVQISNIVKRVMLLLNEDMDELESAVVYGDMGMELRRLAEDLIESGVRKTFLEASVDEIDEVKVTQGGYSYSGSGTGEMLVPAGYLRLVELRMSGWNDSLTAYGEPQSAIAGSVETDDEEEEFDMSREWLRHHSASINSQNVTSRLRAQSVEVDIMEWKPCVKISFGVENRILRIYGVAEDDKLIQLSYLPEPRAGETTIWIPQSLVEKSVRTIAEMVKEIIQE